MREILFKAKRIDNGEWVEGFLIKDLHEEEWYIGFLFGGGAHDTDVVQINSETICQYTGLTDKNGNKIWENDVVKGRHWAENESYYNFQVDCNEKSGLILFESPTANARLSIHDFYDFKEVEVIGNIFDNPELLEGSEENG